MFNNLFRAVGSKVDRPFASSRRLYMVVNRRDRTVKVRSRRSNQACEFSWALPTDFRDEPKVEPGRRRFFNGGEREVLQH